jgi:hypothetical protein
VSYLFSLQNTKNNHGSMLEHKSESQLLSHIMRCSNIPLDQNLFERREELGIIAKPKATMYFNGKWTSVSYDATEDLARNGTDIIFMEKKGVVELFCEYADDYGIRWLLSNNGTTFTRQLHDTLQRSIG